MSYAEDPRVTEAKAFRKDLQDYTFNEEKDQQSLEALKTGLDTAIFGMQMDIQWHEHQNYHTIDKFFDLAIVVVRFGKNLGKDIVSKFLALTKKVEDLMDILYYEGHGSDRTKVVACETRSNTTWEFLDGWMTSHSANAMMEGYGGLCLWNE